MSMSSRSIRILALTTIFALIAVSQARADPAGASILSATTAGTPSASPDSRADARGTITTLVLDSVQQDQQWKAYVGNVSGRLSLDDGSDFTIYDWELAGSIAGEVYVTRLSSVSWQNVSCANAGNISQEESFLNMTGAQSDSINRTYNSTSHDGFFIGSSAINANQCKSTATYRNDTAQTIDGSQEFQAILLQDFTQASSNLLFATIISDDVSGYDNNPHDFQVIVPENDINSTPQTYYFFTELDG